jgi:hypothetical protein
MASERCCWPHKQLQQTFFSISSLKTYCPQCGIVRVHFQWQDPRLLCMTFAFIFLGTSILCLLLFLWFLLSPICYYIPNFFCFLNQYYVLLAKVFNLILVLSNPFLIGKGQKMCIHTLANFLYDTILGMCFLSHERWVCLCQ